MLVSRAELVGLAGVDPWTLRDDLTAGDPAAIQNMGRGFDQGAQLAQQAVAAARRASTTTADAALFGGTPGHDGGAAIAATSRSLGEGGQEMVRVAGALDRVSSGLTRSQTQAASIVDQLDDYIEQIGKDLADWASRQAGMPLAPGAPDPRQVAIDAIVKAVTKAGDAVKQRWTAFNDMLAQAGNDLGMAGFTGPDAGLGDPKLLDDDVLLEFKPFAQLFGFTGEIPLDGTSPIQLDGRVGAEAEAKLTPNEVAGGGFVGGKLEGKKEFSLTDDIGLSLNAEGRLGVGADAGLRIGPDESGRFRVGGSLGAAWGLGGKLGLELTFGESNGYTPLAPKEYDTGQRERPLGRRG